MLDQRMLHSDFPPTSSLEISHQGFQGLRIDWLKLGVEFRQLDHWISIVRSSVDVVNELQEVTERVEHMILRAELGLGILVTLVGWIASDLVDRVVKLQAQKPVSSIPLNGILICVLTTNSGLVGRSVLPKSEALFGHSGSRHSSQFSCIFTFMNQKNVRQRMFSLNLRLKAFIQVPVEATTQATPFEFFSRVHLIHHRLQYVFRWYDKE